MHEVVPLSMCEMEVSQLFKDFDRIRDQVHLKIVFACENTIFVKISAKRVKL